MKWAIIQIKHQECNPISHIIFLSCQKYNFQNLIKEIFLFYVHNFILRSYFSSFCNPSKMYLINQISNKKLSFQSQHQFIKQSKSTRVYSEHKVKVDNHKFTFWQNLQLRTDTRKVKFSQISIEIQERKI